MAETKLTKRDYFSQLREIVKDNESLVAFIDREIELLNRKNSSRSDVPSKTQIENKELSNKILEIMAGLGTAKTITDLINDTEIGKLTFGKDNKEMTNQKLSRLVNDMAKANLVTRTVVKGVAYFKAN